MGPDPAEGGSLAARGWHRFRLAAKLELVGTAAILVLLVTLLSTRTWLHRDGAGVGRLTVVETRLAEHRKGIDDLLPLAGTIPMGKATQELERRMEQNNRILEPFGYRLVQVSGQHFALYRGSEPVLSSIISFQPATVSARGDDFIFAAETSTGQHYLVQAGGVREWDPAPHRFQPPVYVGNDLVEVWWDEQHRTLRITRGSRALFVTSLDEAVPTVVRLHSWAGQWVLEVDGLVFIDGQRLGGQQGYDEVFSWQLLDGRPIFLFRRGSEYGIAYDGQELPRRYEQVPHNLCCEPAVLNPKGTNSALGFFGLRNGVWYWVEVRPATELHE